MDHASYACVTSGQIIVLYIFSLHDLETSFDTKVYFLNKELLSFV